MFIPDVSMTLFDLLFLALLFAAVITLLTAGWLAARKEFRRSRRILARLLACAIAYMAVVVIVSLISPRRVLQANATQCFDDWCIAVAASSHTPQDGGTSYHVDLRLSSRARRVSQRENNLLVYLTDRQGQRHDSTAASGAPLNALLRPGESVIAGRSFFLPAGAEASGLVITHQGGGFPISWFIIGYDTWFRKPAIVQLQ